MLAAPGDTTCMVFNALRRDPGVDAVILENPIARTELLKRRVRRLGLGTVAGQVAFQAIVSPALKRMARRRIATIKRELALDDTPIPDPTIRRVGSANGPDAIALLRMLSPRVVVVNGTRILSREVLSSLDASFINTHAGITPLYRGVHGGYWALAHRDSEHCGVTVHLVNEGIDTGGILAQARISPTAEDSFATYPYLQIGAALPLLVRAVRDALSRRLSTLPPPAGASRLWSHPTAWQYLRVRLLAGVK
jgi:folate-dependent phosphoribosylglycinamide formyltransferase PurN